MNLAQTDLSRFLSPISDTAPAGENIEYSSVYEEICQAREFDNDVVQDDNWNNSIRYADWKKVSTLCIQVLEQESKDLQIACWLTQAQHELYGPEGTTAALGLMTSLLETFWASIWPELDTDDNSADMRLARLNWLDTALTQQLTKLPLGDDDTLTLSQWEQVQYFERTVAANEGVSAALQQDGYFGTDEWNKRVRRLSLEHIDSVMKKVQGLGDALKALDDTLDNLVSAGCAAMSKSRKNVLAIVDLLSRCREIISPYAEDTVTEDKGENTENSTKPLSTATSHLECRAQAISQMLSAAHYFRVNEPTSPVPYLLERAARWANTGMAEWLGEMMENNSSSLQEIMRILKGPQDDTE